MSQRWSCDTLMVGYADVMGDALDADEKALQEEIKVCSRRGR